MPKTTCKCGAEFELSSRSLVDIKFCVRRCHDCYDANHAKEVVERAKAKKEAYEENLKLQKLERKAKADKLIKAFEGAGISKDKRYSSSAALKNRNRRAIIEAKRELDLINAGYL